MCRSAPVATRLLKSQKSAPYRVSRNPWNGGRLSFSCARTRGKRPSKVRNRGPRYPRPYIADLVFPRPKSPHFLLGPWPRSPNVPRLGQNAPEPAQTPRLTMDALQGPDGLLGRMSGCGASQSRSHQGTDLESRWQLDCVNTMFTCPAVMWTSGGTSVARLSAECFRELPDTLHQRTPPSC